MAEQHASKMCLACNREYGSELSVCPHDKTALISIGVPDPFAGTTIGRYVIKELIGKTYSANVYLAEQDGELVAAHITQLTRPLNQVLLTGMTARLKDIRKLVHPNINRIREFSMLPDKHLMVVGDLINGQSLEDMTPFANNDLKDVFTIFADVCDALDYAHGEGVLHSDIKPSNIMMSARGVQLVDFDYVTTYVTDQCQTCCQELGAGMMIDYKSPEHVMGRPLRPASDLYSLGCCLFKTLTNISPFKGFNYLQTASKHLSSAAPPAGTRELDAFFAAALAKNWEDRFHTGSDFKTALAKVAGM